MPRYSAMVPSVTTSEGRPRTETIVPLKAPSRPPKASASGIAARMRHAGLHKQAEDDAGQRQNRGDRKIDLAGDDEQHHRQDQQRLFRRTPAVSCDRLKPEKKFGTKRPP